MVGPAQSPDLKDAAVVVGTDGTASATFALPQGSGARTPDQVGFGRHVDAPPKALFRVDTRAIDLEWRVLLLCTGSISRGRFPFPAKQQPHMLGPQFVATQNQSVG